jgi:hypothetical protein
MKKIITTVIFAFLIASLSFSQSCFPNGFYITHQWEVDNFSTNFPNCTEIEGYVWISGDQITNLNGLSSITAIGDFLRIEKTMLTDLTGLEGLTSVGGDLEIGRVPLDSGNPLLEDLKGLDNLSSVGEAFYIINNPSLTSLEGLESFTTIEELWIRGNAALSNLDGLNNLTRVNNSFYITRTNIQNLSGLENLTSVGGDFSIDHNYALESIADLANLTTVGGGLVIYETSLLTNLYGLEGLTEIGEELEFAYNTALTNIDGLLNIKKIGEDLDISSNIILPNLNGLKNIESVGGWLEFSYNNAVVSLEGLESLTYIGDNLELYQNQSLTSFKGLENLTHVGSWLYLNDNPNLTDITGLENIDPESMTGLNLYGNNSLSECAISNFCEFFKKSGVYINIEDNGVGCNSKEEVEVACDALVYCYPNGITFTSQDEIDDFQENNATCIEFSGDVIFANSDIRDVDGLDMITAIGRDLIFMGNNNLEDLTGLSNVVSIGGNLEIIDNDVLTDLTGLENIDPSTIQNLSIYDNDILVLCDLEPICSYLAEPLGNVIINNNGIGCNSGAEVEDFCTNSSSCFPNGMIFTNQAQIDFFSANFPNCTAIEGNIMIQGNDIDNLDGLNFLVALGGDLEIIDNPLLTDLSGLGGIDPSSIQNLSIYDNPLLELCAVEIICTYLENPGGTVDIHDNAIGCNSRVEVETKCTSATSEIDPGAGITIYPNPALDEIFIMSSIETNDFKMKLYNQYGQRVLQIDQIENPIDISIIGPGMYIIEIISGKERIFKKIIKSSLR